MFESRVLRFFECIYLGLQVAIKIRIIYFYPSVYNN